LSASRRGTDDAKMRATSSKVLGIESWRSSLKAKGLLPARAPDEMRRSADTEG
jgi:hypothetical protein